MFKEPAEREQFASQKDFLEKESLRTNMEIIDLKISQERINMDDFIDYYGREEVEKDKDFAKRLKEKYENLQKKLPKEEQENHRIAKMLEKVIEEVAELNEWFGGEAIVLKTCDYDDYKNGTDLVIEFNEEEKRSFLAVDVCLSSDYDRVEEKVEKNVRKTERDFSSAEVKYYCSEVEGSDGEIYKGKIEKPIPVVIGIDRNNAENLFDDCAEFLQTGNKEAKERIRRSEAQIIFLDQIKKQLETYKVILQNKEALKKIENLLRIIDNVKTEKEGEEFKEGKHDKMRNNIEIACERQVI